VKSSVHRISSNQENEFVLGYPPFERVGENEPNSFLYSDWPRDRNELILFTLTLMHAFQDRPLYFLARDASIMYDIATYLKANIKELNTANLHLGFVSTACSKDPLLLNYISQTSELPLQGLSKIVYVDTGINGSIHDKIAAQMRENDLGRPTSVFLKSSHPFIPQFWQIDKFLKGFSFRAIEYEFRHASNSCDKFKQIQGKIEAISTSLANEKLQRTNLKFREDLKRELQSNLQRYTLVSSRLNEVFRFVLNGTLQKFDGFEQLGNSGFEKRDLILFLRELLLLGSLQFEKPEFKKNTIEALHEMINKGAPIDSTKVTNFTDKQVYKEAEERMTQVAEVAEHPELHEDLSYPEESFKVLLTDNIRRAAVLATSVGHKRFFSPFFKQFRESNETRKKLIETLSTTPKQKEFLYTLATEMRKEDLLEDGSVFLLIQNFNSAQNKDFLDWLTWGKVFEDALKPSYELAVACLMAKVEELPKRIEFEKFSALPASSAFGELSIDSLRKLNFEQRRNKLQPLLTGTQCVF
jgi:hypothetical protein